MDNGTLGSDARVTPSPRATSTGPTTDLATGPVAGPTTEPSAGLEDLLQPSLTESTPPIALYSVQAGFLIAFIGGGLATLVFSVLNSKRLGRLAGDAWLYGLGVVFFCGLPVAYAQGFEFPYLGDMADSTRTKRYVTRALSLLYFGMLFLNHRRFYKVSELCGEKSPNPWRVALAALAMSFAVNFAITSQFE